jgi:nucleotide-binding universal stress UspA family protein
MAATDSAINIAWWSAGPKIERVLRDAPCSVLCMRGRPIREKDWKRPRLHHVLLLTELDDHGERALEKITPWVLKFDSLLHLFPLLKNHPAGPVEETVLTRVNQVGPPRTNVLMFADPDNRVHNLFDVIAHKPIDLVVMTPWTRSEFSLRWINDVLVRLLRDARCPILVVR